MRPFPFTYANRMTLRAATRPRLRLRPFEVSELIFTFFYSTPTYCICSTSKRFHTKGSFRCPRIQRRIPPELRAAETIMCESKSIQSVFKIRGCPSRTPVGI